MPKLTKEQESLRLRKMQIQKEKIARWKKRIASAAAKDLKTKLEKVSVRPWNSKQKTTIAHKIVKEAVCPINQRLYYVVWDLR